MILTLHRVAAETLLSPFPHPRNAKSPEGKTELKKAA